MNWFTNLFSKKQNNSQTDNESELHKPGLGETGESVYIETEEKGGILSMAGNLFTPKPEEYIYISVGSVSLKVVSTTKLQNGRCKLLWLEEIFLGPLNAQVKGESVDDIYKVLPAALDKIKDKITEQKNIFVSLPTQGVFFKNISIPKIANGDKLLEAEVKKVIPIPFEDVLFANNVIWSNENSETHLCVVMQKEFVSRFEEIFNIYQVKAYFEIEPFSLLEFYIKMDK
jgi:Tfp pilus assembly PilM family ATPase